jgi:signal transduction histidine kinase
VSIEALLRSAAEVDAFSDRAVERTLIDEVVQTATGADLPRYATPPWRVLVIVGAERERLIAKLSEALGRHHSIAGDKPRGLASEAVMAAPVWLLVLSTVPEWEAYLLSAGAVQSMVLVAAEAGLGTHRISSAYHVPEAVLDYASEFLGPQIRGADVVTLLAVGWPAEGARAKSARKGTAPLWVGDGSELPETMPPLPSDDLRPPAEVLRARAKERVVVVDSYPFNRALLEAQLVRAGYEVEVYSEGASVPSPLAMDPPALYIISDTLPDTHGFELVRRITGGGREKLAPVIVTAARRDSGFRVAGLAAGVDYYLRRPVNAVELYTAARILVDRHRLIEDLRRLLDELRTAQGRLVQHAKMAALGQLVAGVAHEINTPLAAVVNNNDLFLRIFERMRRGKSDARDLSAIEDLSRVTQLACQRMSDIVRTLRTFARLDEADVKAVDLHEGIESTLVLIAHLTKSGITVERHFDRLPLVECYPNQINQVLMNLCVNACQAMGDRGTLTVATHACADGQHVEVTIGDTGVGIPSERLPHIFEPGYTTKGAPLGTGLGLSIVYQIVEGHGGEIFVDSKPGVGTSFKVRLPIRDVREALE